MVESGTKWFEVVGDCMFMGEYNHTIDAKGRLIIPSRFREVLGDDFVVTKGLDGCLFVYDNTEWSAFEEKLKALPLMNKESRKFVRFFLAGAANVEVDKQGRILIPSVLREFAASKSGAKKGGRKLRSTTIWMISQSICLGWDS